jgi:predicted RNA-binding Zn-ribbon protein involved in translation (DUF1610 family)
MPQYSVKVDKISRSFRYIVVDADDPEQAERKAEKKASDLYFAELTTEYKAQGATLIPGSNAQEVGDNVVYKLGSNPVRVQAGSNPVSKPKKVRIEETPLQKSYTNAECPDCGESISAKAVEGDECPNCGHVLTTATNVRVRNGEKE